MDLAFCLLIEIPIHQKSRTGILTQMVDIGKVATIQDRSSLSVALLRMQLGVNLSGFFCSNRTIDSIVQLKYKCTIKRVSGMNILDLVTDW
jgi:hypothetical protein